MANVKEIKYIVFLLLVAESFVFPSPFLSSVGLVHQAEAIKTRAIFSSDEWNDRLEPGHLSGRRKISGLCDLLSLLPPGQVTSHKEERMQSRGRLMDERLRVS
jgi:hypothetical protein